MTQAHQDGMFYQQPMPQMQSPGQQMYMPNMNLPQQQYGVPGGMPQMQKGYY